MADFKNKIVGGVIYDLSHLDQFLLSLEIDKSTYAVEIAFSSHCFTEKLQPHHTPDLRYSHDGEHRTFNVARYELSKSLRGMFQALGNRTVYRSERRDYFVFRDVDISSEKIPYITFFNVIRSTKKGVNVRLIVTSAYLKPGMSRRASPVKFTNLIDSIATGKPLRAGQKQTIKRK